MYNNTDFEPSKEIIKESFSSNEQFDTPNLDLLHENTQEMIFDYDPSKASNPSNDYEFVKIFPSQPNEESEQVSNPKIQHLQHKVTAQIPDIPPNTLKNCSNLFVNNPSSVESKPREKRKKMPTKKVNPSATQPKRNKSEDTKKVSSSGKESFNPQDLIIQPSLNGEKSPFHDISNINDLPCNGSIFSCKSFILVIDNDGSSGLKRGYTKLDKETIRILKSILKGIVHKYAFVEDMKKLYSLNLIKDFEQRIVQHNCLNQEKLNLYLKLFDDVKRFDQNKQTALENGVPYLNPSKKEFESFELFKSSSKNQYYHFLSLEVVNLKRKIANNVGLNVIDDDIDYGQFEGIYVVSYHGEVRKYLPDKEKKNKFVVFSKSFLNFSSNPEEGWEKLNQKKK